MSDVRVKIRDNFVTAALTMGARQIILGASGWLFGQSMVNGGGLELAASGVAFMAITGWGQVRGWVDKGHAVKLADSADIGEVESSAFQAWLATPTGKKVAIAATVAALLIFAAWGVFA